MFLFPSNCFLIATLEVTLMADSFKKTFASAVISMVCGPTRMQVKREYSYLKTI